MTILKIQNAATASSAPSARPWHPRVASAGNKLAQQRHSRDVTLEESKTRTGCRIVSAKLLKLILVLQAWKMVACDVTDDMCNDNPEFTSAEGLQCSQYLNCDYLTLQKAFDYSDATILDLWWNCPASCRVPPCDTLAENDGMNSEDGARGVSLGEDILFTTSLPTQNPSSQHPSSTPTSEPSSESSSAASKSSSASPSADPTRKPSPGFSSLTVDGIAKVEEEPEQGFGANIGTTNKNGLALSFAFIAFVAGTSILLVISVVAAFSLARTKRMIKEKNIDTIAGEGGDGKERSLFLARKKREIKEQGIGAMPEEGGDDKEEEKEPPELIIFHNVSIVPEDAIDIDLWQDAEVDKQEEEANTAKNSWQNTNVMLPFQGPSVVRDLLQAPKKNEEQAESEKPFYLSLIQLITGPSAEAATHKLSPGESAELRTIISENVAPDDGCENSGVNEQSEDNGARLDVADIEVGTADGAQLKAQETENDADEGERSKQKMPATDSKVAAAMTKGLRARKAKRAALRKAQEQRQQKLREEKEKLDPNMSVS